MPPESWRRSELRFNLLLLLLLQVDHRHTLGPELGDARFPTMNRAFNRKKGEQKNSHSRLDGAKSGSEMTVKQPIPPSPTHFRRQTLISMRLKVHV